jgi:hypothetical protein
MFRACILGMAILFGGVANASPLLQQDSENKSAASPQSQAPSQPPGSPQPQDQSAAGKSKDQQSEAGKPQDSSQSAPAENKASDQAPTAKQPRESENSSNPPQPENKQQPQGAQPGLCSSAASAQGNCAKPAAKQSHRVVIRRGSTGEPTTQLSSGMTPEQAAQHRHTTEEFLKSAEDDLTKLGGRNLNQDQQDTVSQIRNYMLGSHSALDDGDLSRARILAFKAHLLADDLMKH